MELSAKRLEMLKEVLPRAKRFAVLLHRDNSTNEQIMQTMAVAAKSLKVELQWFEVRGAGERERGDQMITRASFLIAMGARSAQ